MFNSSVAVWKAMTDLRERILVLEKELPFLKSHDSELYHQLEELRDYLGLTYQYPDKRTLVKKGKKHGV